MRKKRGSRLDDVLHHDIPVYPFSNTPDGRIVGELHRSRNESKSFHERSLALHEQAVKALERQHGGQVVVQREKVDQQAVVEALGKVSHGLSGLYASVEAGTDKIVQTNAEGFKQVHNDLARIKGPTPAADFLEDVINDQHDLISVLSLYGKGLLNGRGQQNAARIVDSLLQDSRVGALTELRNLAPCEDEGLTHEDINNLSAKIRNISDLFYILNSPDVAFADLKEAYRLALKTKNGFILAFIQRVKEVLQLYMAAVNEPVSQELLIALSNGNFLVPQVQSRLMKDFPEARLDPSLASINYNLADILKSSKVAELQRNALIGQNEHAIGQRDVLIRLAENLKADSQTAISQRERIISLARMAYNQRHEIIEQGRVGISQRNILIRQALHSIGQRNRLIEQGEMNIDLQYKILDQGDVAERQRSLLISQGEKGLEHDEVAIRQGFAHISLAEIGVEQRSTAIKEQRLSNYRLGLIADELVRTQGEVVNLKNIVAEFGMRFLDATRVMHSTLKSGFQDLDSEIVLTRVAVVEQLKGMRRVTEHYGMSIVDELQQLKDLIRHGHKTEAQQYFEDGIGCLRVAEDEDDVRDALDSFLKGVELVKMSSGNWYGAGLCSSLLGKKKQAKKFFRKAGKRAQESEAELGSLAYEKIVDICFEDGNFEEAAWNCQKAIEQTPGKLSLYFLLARCQAVLGDHERSFQTLLALLSKDQNYFLYFLADPLFQNFSDVSLELFYTDLWEKNVITNPHILTLVFQETIVKSPQVASKIFALLLGQSPDLLIKKKVWLHPHLPKIYYYIEQSLSDFMNKQVFRVPLRHCYSLMYLFYKLGEGNVKYSLSVLRRAIELDISIKNIGERNVGAAVYRRLKSVADGDIYEFWSSLSEEAPDDLVWIFD